MRRYLRKKNKQINNMKRCQVLFEFWQQAYILKEAKTMKLSFCEMLRRIVNVYIIDGRSMKIGINYRDLDYLARKTAEKRRAK